MEQTLSKVKNLGKFIKKHGEDVFISKTISKMLDYKIQKNSSERGCVYTFYKNVTLLDTYKAQVDRQKITEYLLRSTRVFWRI